MRSKIARRGPRRRRKWLLLILLAVALIRGYPALRSWLFPTSPPAVSSEETRAGLRDAREAFDARLSDVWVSASGEVVRLLEDDREGSRHQRFILRLDPDSTLLVVHNIDLAPRVPVRAGDTVQLEGEFEWNERGGLVHWTHHDPAGRRAGGWIRHAGKLYR